ncbi:hypothetical protein FO519_005953 [Halicephalobus sp. NKZ332]|nr:hypothetical protein FO519_005953 [Halicephalobus sp. NKZ332]
MYENYVRIFKDSNCPKSIFALPSNDSRIPVPVGYSSCSLELFKKVQQICNYQNRETAIYLTDSSPVGSYTEDYFVNQWTHQGNVIIMSKAIQKRSTTYSIKGENWKLASDIGGTFALYVGFTFMSVVETVAFFVSKKLRKLIADDDQTLMERKNPPIKFPCLSQRILDRVSFVRKLQEKIKSKAKQDM